jgi:hypothetical protein
MGTQLICFIEKTTFSSLLPQELIRSIQYDNRKEDQLIYINENGTIELSDFDKDKAGKAIIILVSDNFELESKQYQPNKEILFLVHTRTSDERWSWAREDHENLFIGKVREQETKNSSYGKIANWIKDNRDTGVLKQLIKDLLKNIHQETEVVLDFLHECLQSQAISKNTDKLEDNKFKVDFLEGKTIDDLPTIWDELFRQLEKQKNGEKCE